LAYPLVREIKFYEGALFAPIIPVDVSSLQRAPFQTRTANGMEP